MNTRKSHELTPIINVRLIIAQLEFAKGFRIVEAVDFSCSGDPV